VIKSLIGAMIFFIASLVVVGPANSGVLHPVPYSPTLNETYVYGNGGACCIGESPSLTNVYMAQSFVAIAERPSHLVIGLANNSYPSSDFKYKLLLTEFSFDRVGEILYESSAASIPASLGSYNEYVFSLGGTALVPGATYAWIIDTYSTRDGVVDAGAYYANISYDYSLGALYLLEATGLGRAHDFSRQWTNTGIDASFLLAYEVKEPSSLSMGAVGALILLVVWRNGKKTQ